MINHSKLKQLFWAIKETLKKAVIRHCSSQFGFIYLTFVSIKSASTTHFYWAGCPCNPVMSVFEYEHESSKTGVFKWSSMYPQACTLCRAANMESAQETSADIHTSHRLWISSARELVSNELSLSSNPSKVAAILSKCLPKEFSLAWNYLELATESQRSTRTIAA